MKIIRPLMGLLCAAALLTACDKNAVQDITAPSPGSARIKFFNFGVGSPGVNFYANTTKMTAISAVTCTPPSSPECLQAGIESTTGINYGGVGAGGRYMAIDPGQYTLTGRIAAAVDKDLPISSLTTTIADGRFYSYYQSGVYDAATKTVDSFIVEDPFIPNFDYTVAYVRFVNAIFNVDPLVLHLTSSAGGDMVALAPAVAYKGASAFVAVPHGSYTLTPRLANSATNAFAPRTGVSFEAGRVYTITARGNINTASTLLLDNTLNR